MSSLLRVACAVALSAAVASAQFAGPGLRWSGSSGNFAGGFVPSCANQPVTAVPGETVTLSVWGDHLSPFGLFAAASGTQCLPIPGLGNALILDAPIVTVSFGSLTQLTPCLSCPPAFENLQLTIPLGLPRGTSIAFQAAAFGGSRLAFTIAITATV